MIRRDVLMAAAAVASTAGIAGCRTESGRKEAAQGANAPCPPLAPVGVTRRLLADRTTRLPDAQAVQLATQVAAWVSNGRRLQVLLCGGASASLLEAPVDLQMPSAVADARALEVERWSRSPAEVARRKTCEAWHRERADVEGRVLALLREGDHSRHGASPLVEAICAATAQWSPQDSELAVLTDGMQHVPGGGMSFYGPRGLPPAADWIADLRRTDLLPDLKGLRVYHLGIGLPEAGGPPSYPHAHRLKALWQAFWEAANAQVSFGAPLHVQGLGG